MKYQYMIVELGRYSTTLFITEDDWNEIVDSYEDGMREIDLIPNGDGITVIDQEDQIVLRVPVTQMLTCESLYGMMGYWLIKWEKK